MIQVIMMCTDSDWEDRMNVSNDDVHWWLLITLIEAAHDGMDWQLRTRLKFADRADYRDIRW